ncbi:NADH-quinone oxidoreductase subunit L [Caldicellulosiruptoraceae bacterium PP1]
MGLSLLLLIFFPIIMAAIFLLFDNSNIRKAAVFFMSLVLIALMAYVLLGGSREVTLNEGTKIALEYLITFADYFLMAVMFLIGLKYNNKIIMALVVLQFVPLTIFEFTSGKIEIQDVFYVDHLTMIMLMLINVVGPLIAIFALQYMKEHEHHLHLKKSKQNVFFATIALFLGAMNGIVLSNSIAWIYFFWEITTLCSFLLISHDKTKESINNAQRALLLNSIGGVAFVIGIILTYKYANTLEITQLLKSGDASLLIVPIAFLVLAGSTKSAQLPFQSWLLGAMVAPTPVSALLHSSTMVKAGVYLILRLAPLYIDNWLGQIVAVFGGFTFAVAALLAITQTNAKRILAYSTISNLGLIILLSSIPSIFAIYGAALLIVLHGVSKALLFLCVGTIEQGIGSRDIEDMDGIRTRMPLTANMTILGAVSMLLPPFGVLITKWIAIEAATSNPIALALVIFGSAFTVVFWSKFIGKIISTDKNYVRIEKFEALRHTPLYIITLLVTLVSIFMIQFSNTFIAPFIKEAYSRFSNIDQAALENLKIKDFMGFNPVVFFGILLLSIFLGYVIYVMFKPKRYVNSYVSAEDTVDGKFLSIKDENVELTFKNYYLSDILSEKKVTFAANIVSIALIVIMFGVIIK